jgi:hypothetical protein
LNLFFWNLFFCLAFEKQRIGRSASAQSCVWAFARRTRGSYGPGRRGADFCFGRFPLAAAVFDLDLKGATGMTHWLSFFDLLVC